MEVEEKMASNPENEIERITNRISYWDFYQNYIRKNKPCILSAMFTATWSCRKDWLTNDGEPNMDYFEDNFGSYKAPVLDCNKQEYSSHEKTEMRVEEYCEYWDERGDKLLYLKDWHLQRHKTGQSFYSVPEYFTSDWLNEYWDETCENDDYRFVYIGVKDTWTPFHADVFRSFSWSANICGLKKWLFYPPGEEEFLRDKFGKLPFSVIEEVDPNLFPNWSKAQNPIVVYQKAGEVIFVPSGWHHQVFNLEDTISINHNWVNACCIGKMYQHMCDELVNVKKEIDDCRTMDGFLTHCQLILKTSSGIDFQDFYKMITHLVEARLSFVNAVINCYRDSEKLNLLSKYYISSTPGQGYSFGENVNFHEQMKYIHFDLTHLKCVIKLLMKHEDFDEILPDTIEKGINLIQTIDDILVKEK